MPVRLRFEDGLRTDVFAHKNNKTLGETLLDHRYGGLNQYALSPHSTRLATPLGAFLLDLKQNKDNGYLRFLNAYGDLVYSTFVIADSCYLKVKGVYAYYEGDELRYIGRCKDSMTKRINQGYGKIHPKNCYLDGQATNCRLNARITEIRGNVSLWLCALESNETIEQTEILLLRRYRPSWNIQRP